MAYDLSKLSDHCLHFLWSWSYNGVPLSATRGTYRIFISPKYMNAISDQRWARASSCWTLNVSVNQSHCDRMAISANRKWSHLPTAKPTHWRLLYAGWNRRPFHSQWKPCRVECCTRWSFQVPEWPYVGGLSWKSLFCMPLALGVDVRQACCWVYFWELSWIICRYGRADWHIVYDCKTINKIWPR